VVEWKRTVVVRNKEERAGRKGLYTVGKYGHAWFRFRSMVYFRRGGCLQSNLTARGYIADWNLLSA